MDRSKNICTQSNMIETVTIKTEPICEKEVDQLLPDPLETSIKLKTEVICEKEPSINHNDNQKNCEIRNNNSSSFPNRSLININGVFYLIEKIPETLIQNKQTQKVVPQTRKRKLEDPASCPHCGKILKRRRNLKLHMQVCYNNLSYNCGICPYKSSNEILLSLHVGTHGRQINATNARPQLLNSNEKGSHGVNYNCRICPYKTTNEILLSLHVGTHDRQINTTNARPQLLNSNDKAYYSHICLKCNLSTSLYLKACTKCGSLKRWQCKICKKHFDSHSKVRYHYNTKCNPSGYYHCLKCDYRSIYRSRTKVHIKKSHPELISDGILKYIKKIKVSVDENEAKHVCSKCGKKFEEPSSLNRHAHKCKKTRETSKKIQAGFEHFIIHHCQTCEEDIELEKLHVSFQKSCSDCSSTLVYKCTNCGNLHQNYDAIVNHVKTICNQQEQMKCAQCDFVTYRELQLTEHIKRFHGDISATCTNCGSYFKNSTLFERHISYCGLSTTLHCNMCPFITKTKDYLRKHMLTNHDKSNPPNLSTVIKNAKCSFSRVRPHIQSYCGSCRLRQKTNYRVKFCKICHNKLQFRCITCDKMYRIEDPDVCQHVKTYLDQLTFECTRCGKGFHDKSKYQLHEDWCGKTRSYSCKLCAYSTKYITYLRKHERQIHYKHKESKYLQEMCSNQMNQNIAESHNFSYKRRIKLDQKKNIHLIKNKDSNSMSCQDSDKEKNNSNSTCYQYDSENKLNLECKVVLTRLTI